MSVKITIQKPNVKLASYMLQFIVPILMLLSGSGLLQAQTNVALNKPVTVDSFFGATTDGIYAVDGDTISTTSRWLSANVAYPHWIIIDLQNSYIVSKVKFWMGYGGAYSTSVSNYSIDYWNGTAWVSAVTRTGNALGIVTENFTPVTTSKIRLNGTKGADNYLRIYELAVFGLNADNQSPTPPTALSSSNITPNSFTLLWTAATDNVGVVGYDVYKNGVLYGKSTTTSLNITGLDATTAYSMTIIAKDASGNSSVNSQALLVTTANQDPNINYTPTCGKITTIIYANRGQQILILPNVTDGDLAKVQNLSIKVESKDSTKLRIDSVVYKSPDQVAFLYVKDQSLLGSVDLQITLKDDGGIANGGVDTYTTIQTLNVISFKNPCANFVQYDTPHYMPRPTQNTIPTTNSYVKICQTNTPIESLGRDYFWMRMNGYIVPSITDYYTFQGYSNEGFYFYLNLDDGVSTDPKKLTTMVESAGTTWISSSTYLQAGKVYYFEAYARDIVNTQPFWLKWTSSKVPLGFIADDNLAPDFDITKPSTPLNLKVSNLGSNDITLKWDPSTDNDVRGIKGYNIFVNGKIVNDTLITSTEYLIKGLNPSTVYSCHVSAVDYSFNSSVQTEVKNVKTYLVDAIPPPVPTNLTSEYVTSFAIKLHWNSVKDAQTQTRGYNVYQNNVLVAQYCNDTTLLVGQLTPLTNYTFQVSAVDASYNESAKGALYPVSTVAFDPNETRDNVYKGRLSVKLNPLCKFNGIGTNVSFYRNGMMSSNLVSYSGFESLQMDTMTNLSFFQKGVSNASFKRSKVTPYSGKNSAQISYVANGYFRCNIGTQIDKQYTYLVRFAMRRAPGYTGNIQVKMTGTFSGTFVTQNVTPTDDWQMYELELATTYSGGESAWRLDFVSTTSGDVFFDDIQFVNKSCYTPGSPFSTKAMDLLKEFKPSSVRWGAIPANVQSFQYSSGKGSENTLSYADWLQMCNELNCKAFFTTGVQNKTDFIKNPQTFKTFIEYLEGDATTAGGAIRASEGYGDLLSKSKGILIEMGNEVWASGTGFAEIGSNYATYGAWARTSANTMKAAPCYNFDKTRLSYSGRYPGSNYGLHKSMLTGENKELEYLSESGYFGTTLTVDPSVQLATSQLNYHKSSIAMLQSCFDGLTADIKEMLSICGRALPIYMYEGNMTQSTYYGRLGQAITFADYYTSVPLYGVPNACVFNLDQGEWRMIDDQISFKKLPLFHVGKYINTYCTGTMLETNFTSSTKIYKGTTPLNIDPVGCRAYTDTTSYSVAMFSRDFEHDYVVQLDIPNNVGNGATCKLITISGASYSSQDVVITEQNLTNFKDSILVTVPKYGLCIVRFDGINQHYNAPEVYTSYKKAQSVKITTPGNVLTINTNRGHLILTGTILPSDAFLTTPNWNLLDNTTIGANHIDGTTTTTLYGNGLATGNGYIRVVASVNDGSNLADTVTVLINKQGGVDISAVENVNKDNILLYPVPAKDYLKMLLPADLLGTVSIINLNGAILYTEAIKSREINLDIHTLKQGVYLIKLEVSTGPMMLKFVKQ